MKPRSLGLVRESSVTEKLENLGESHDHLGQKHRFFWHLGFLENEEEESIGIFPLLTLGYF